jgi:hypothetical protein
MWNSAYTTSPSRPRCVRTTSPLENHFGRHQLSTVDKEPHMLDRSSMLATLALLTAIAPQAVGQVRSGTKIGTLNCELAPSVGFIVGSHQPMRCRYTPDGPFPPEFYEGVINTIGLDIGFTTGGVMTWSVVAPTVGPPRGALAGLYVGASGDVTAGGSYAGIWVTTFD